jgi:large subunit ribosomal protein L46
MPPKLTRPAASPSSLHHICSSCLQTLSRRSYASAATAKASLDTQSLNSTNLASTDPHPSPAAQPTYTIKAGIVVSRPPLLTPDPHPFETAYHLYQRRLNERLVLPFTQYFFYRRNTPAFEHWRKHRRARAGTAARDIGAYSAYTKDSWNDEVLVGDETGRPEKIVEALISEEGRQAEFTGKGDSKYAGLRRTTEADEKGDLRSLERRLQRTLYLLVKTKGSDGQEGDEHAEKWKWKFPSGPVVGFEGLKEVSSRRWGTLLLSHERLSSVMMMMMLQSALYLD